MTLLVLHYCPHTHSDFRVPLGTGILPIYRNLSAISHLCKCFFRHVVMSPPCSRPSFKLVCIDSDGSDLNYMGVCGGGGNSKPIRLKSKWKINLLIKYKINFRNLFLKESHYSLMSYDGMLERNNKLNVPSKWKCTNMVKQQASIKKIYWHNACIAVCSFYSRHYQFIAK